MTQDTTVTVDSCHSSALDQSTATPFVRPFISTEGKEIEGKGKGYPFMLCCLKQTNVWINNKFSKFEINL